MRIKLTIAAIILFAFTQKQEETNPIAIGSWIRINWLGYQPGGVKVAVWCSKQELGIRDWELVDTKTNKVVFTGNTGKAFGTYGPFKQTYRLNFS